MELKEALAKRRSVRKYTDEPVSLDDIEELLHAAMSGPSACRCDPWSFYVVTSPEILEKLRGASRYSGIKAPLAIVICGELSRALPRQLAPYWIQDCSAAAENILLRAVDLGLGAVWCGIHPQQRAEDRVREILSLTENQVPLNIIHIGHPAEEPEPGDRYDTKHVFFIE